jgi:hypothetical protein
MAAIVAVMVMTLVERYRLERLRHEVDELRVACQTRSLDAAEVRSQATRS